VRLDPFVTKDYDRHRASKASRVEAVTSSHIWQAALPAGLEPGTHRVAVRATDGYGRFPMAPVVPEATG
jgi:hypothetical protein